MRRGLAVVAVYALALFLAIQEYTNGGATGKWATATNWTPLAEKPKASQDAKVPTGKTVEVTAAAVCRSLALQGTAVLSGTSSITIGNAEKPEGPAGTNWAVKVDATTTMSGYTAPIVLSSTCGETLKVSIGVSYAGSMTINTGAKYLLEGALTCTAAGGIAVNESAWLDTNGFAVTVQKILTGAKKVTVKLHGSTVTLTGTAGWEGPGIESTLEAAAATIVLEASGSFFSGGGWTYGSLTVQGTKVMISGNNTFAGVVTFNNKNAAVEEGLRLAKGSKQVLTGATPLACNGEAGHLARLEAVTETAELEATGTGAGAAHEVRADGSYEPANSFIAAKGVRWTRGTLYLANGKDEGGNEKVVFGAEPSTGAKGASAAIASVAGRLQAQGSPKGAATATGTAAGKGQAQGNPRGASTATGTARALAAGTADAHGRSQATAAGAARGQASGVPRGRSQATGDAHGSAQAAGLLRGGWLASGLARAVAAAPGVLRGASSGTGAAAGRAQASGVSRGQSQASGAARGAAQAGGLLRGTTAGTVAARASAAAAGVLRGAASAVGVVAGRGQAPGALHGATVAASTWLARIESILQLRGRSDASGGAHGALQAPGRAAGRWGATGVVRGAAQASGMAAGVVSVSSAWGGLAGALGGLRGRVEAAGVWLGHLLGPSGVKTCEAAWAIVPRARSNVLVVELVEGDVEVSAVAGAKVMIVGGG